MFISLNREKIRDPDNPDAILPPPMLELPDGTTVPVLSADRLKELVVQAGRDVGLQTPPHPDRPEGWPVVWGEQLEVKVIRRGLDGGDLTQDHVAAYLAKYATKGSEAAGLTATRLTRDTIGAYTDPGSHVGRLVASCWRLGRYMPGLLLSQQSERPYGGLRRWAHMLGFGGHFSSKSRRYAFTLGKFRRARVIAARALARGVTPEQLADLADDQAAIVINSQWAYVGTGWLTTGDAALATMAADASRSRRPANTGTPAREALAA